MSHIALRAQPELLQLLPKHLPEQRQRNQVSLTRTRQWSRSLHHHTLTARPEQNPAALIPTRVCTTETHSACSLAPVLPFSASGEPDPLAILGPCWPSVPLTPWLRLPCLCDLEVVSKKTACCSIILRVKEERLSIFVN